MIICDMMQSGAPWLRSGMHPGASWNLLDMAEYKHQLPTA
jgi:hypothetical protein